MSIAALSSELLLTTISSIVKDFMETQHRWAMIKAITPNSFDPHLHLSKSFLMQLKTIEPTYTIKLVRDYIVLCLDYASIAKDTVMESKMRLVDGMDDTVRLMASRILNNEVFQAPAFEEFPGAEPHWTHIPMLVPGDVPGPGTFMNYMIWSGREWYVKEKVSQGMDIRQTPHFIPLIFSAIDAAATMINLPNHSNDKHLEFVKFLLENGADPNERFQGTSLLRKAWAIKGITERAREDIQDLIISYGASRDRKTAIIRTSANEKDQATRWSFRQFCKF